MSREEAITIIGNLEDKDILFNPCDVQDAKTMAIKALEQEPSGDLISRQAVIEKAVYTETEEGWYGYTVDIDYIKSLPSVKQEPKTGYWVHKGQGIYCSECGKESGYNPFGASRFSDYCPACGVKMVEPQKSEDCRKCKKWEDCPCGKEGHESGTSQGYSIGECKDFEPQESEE